MNPDEQFIHDSRRETRIKSAKWFLSEVFFNGGYCWCGQGQGHNLGHCHFCGQPFKQERLNRVEVFKRILENRRSHRGTGGWDSLTENTYSTWRYLACPDGTLEEYRAAFKEVVKPRPVG